MATIVGIDNEQPERGEARWVIYFGDGEYVDEEVDVNARDPREAQSLAEEWAKDNLVDGLRVVQVEGPMFGYY